jgi:vancomycin resistance protein YoaR
VNTPESTDSSGRGTDPYRRDPYESPFAPQPQDPGLYDSGSPPGATDLLDFPPLPPYPDEAYPSGAYPSGAYPGTDHGSAAIPEPAEAFAEPEPARDPAGAGQPSGLRISSDAEATARLLIKLPAAPPQPSTTLRPHAAWEDRDADTELPDGIPGPRRGAAPATPFAQVAASPARPSALPSELAALTTATLVVPLPRDSRPTPALLTTTLPPDMAAQQNAALLADAFHDTLEQVFGIDLDAVSPAELGLGAPAGRSVEADDFDPQLDADLPGDWFRDETGAGLGVRADALSPLPGAAWSDTALFEGEFEDVDQTPYEYVPGLVPAATFGGAYGVPTQPAAFPGFAAQDNVQQDSARHALALRYLGGIFHDSSGESSYLDPDSFAARSLRGASELALTAGPSAPPDAPTEQLTRIPAQKTQHEPRHGAGAKLKTASGSAGNASRSTTRNNARNNARADRGSRHGVADPDEAAETRRSGSRLLTAAAVLAAGFAILYGLALAVAGGVFGGTLPRGTVVDGVSIGGLSPAAAERAVTAGLGARARGPVQLRVGQTPGTLDPARAGLGLDAASTVAAAQQDRTNPLVVIPALFGATHQIAPVTTVDVTALTRALTGIAASYNSPMVEGGITFHNGVPVVTAPKQGRGFSIDGAVVAIHAGYLRVSGPIRIPVQALDPKASPAALQDALEHLARPAVASPIALVTGAVTTVLTPAQIGDALVIAPDGSGRLVATVDGARLRGYLGANALAQEQAAANAAFTVTDGKPVLVPARDGRGFAPDALAQAVLGVLTQTQTQNQTQSESSPRTATVPIGALPAAFTTADAQALGVTDVLGSNTLPVASAPNRFANVQRATTLAAGGIVQPGETWSFVRVVGAPTTANGFAVTAAAQRAGVDPSGGMDTVATAVFGAAFASGMGDTVHHPHASYIDRYPVGLDAAVVAPGTDLQWTNPGQHPVYVYASYANDALTVALLGEKSYDQVQVQVSQRTAIVQPSGRGGSGCAQGAVPGFQVDVTRTLLKEGSQVGAEQYHVTYLPQGGQGCSGSSASPGTAVGGGPSTGTGSGGGSSGSGGGSSAPSPAPSPSPTGILGGLLH